MNAMVLSQKARRCFAQQVRTGLENSPAWRDSREGGWNIWNGRPTLLGPCTIILDLWNVMNLLPTIQSLKSHLLVIQDSWFNHGPSFNPPAPEESIQPSLLLRRRPRHHNQSHPLPLARPWRIFYRSSSADALDAQSHDNLSLRRL